MEYHILSSIRDYFDDIKGLSGYLSKSSEFDVPCSIERISVWEKTNFVQIPEMYKSWLLLTSSSYIYGGYCELFMPEIIDENSDDVLIGNLIGDGEYIYFSKSTAEIYTLFEGDKEIYNNFEELLSRIYSVLEEAAEEEYGEDWVEICPF